jgi:hypothetical protein
VAKKTAEKTGPSSPRPRAKRRRANAALDVALVIGRDEEGVRIIRRRSQEAPLEAGVLQPLREGHPISGEVISLKQRADFPFAYDVTTELPAPEASESDGPPQVASPAYRKGWDAIWGGRRRGPVN